MRFKIMTILEAPTSKPQAPENGQTGKRNPVHKPSRFGDWCLGVSLELGCWSLELSSRSHVERPVHRRKILHMFKSGQNPFVVAHEQQRGAGFAADLADE